MKQKSLFKQFFLLVLLLVGSATGAWADEVFYTLDGTDTDCGGNSNYAEAGKDVVQDGINWSVTANCTQSPWRIGGKSLSNVDREVYSKTPMGSPISKVILSVGAASNITVNSLKLIVASDADFTNILDEVTGSFSATSNITFLPTSPATTWDNNSYYKIIFNVTVSGNSNRYVQFIYADFHAPNNITSISANDVEIEYNTTAGTIESTINNPVEGGVLTAEKKTTADWLTLVTVSGTNVPFTTTANEGNEDREATVTLTYTYGSPASTVTKDVTITQGHFVADYAVLPFTFNGGKADIETTTGLTQSGLDSDYSSAPKLKFNSTGDYLILKINETPGVLSFDIKGNNFSGGTFKVQASSDGENYSDVATYTSLGDTENQEIDNLASNVRYIKWIYTEKSSGNVALGNISLVKPATPKTATTTTIDATGITNTNLDKGTAAGQLTASVKAGETPVGGATVTWTSSNEKVATVDAEGIVTLKKKGTTTITATYAGDETYASSNATYELTVTSEIQPTAIVSDFNYSTIGSGEGAELSEETAIDLDGVMMTLDKGNNNHYPRGDANYIRFYQHNTMKLEAPAGYVITSVEFTEPSTNRAWSDLNVDAGIYTNEGNGDGGSWEGVTSTLTFTGKDGACRMAGINITLAPGTNVTDAEWATYVTVVNTDFANSTGIKAYKAVNTTADGIKLEEITEAPKGTAVIIAASEKGYVLTEAASTPAAVTGNILQVSDGTITGDYDSTTQESTYYVLGKNTSEEVGFGPLAKGVTLAKGKAYIHKNDWDTATAKDFLPFVIGDEESETTSIRSIENSELRIENYDYIYNLAGQKVSKDYKGIVVVNGKKVIRK